MLITDDTRSARQRCSTPAAAALLPDKKGLP